MKKNSVRPETSGVATAVFKHLDRRRGNWGMSFESPGLFEKKFTERGEYSNCVTLIAHKDGGALCMKTYGHLRETHSQAQAQRVAF